MDKELIKMLEIRLEYYEKEFKKLKDKSDSEIVLKHGEKYYLAPLLKFVFPFIRTVRKTPSFRSGITGLVL